MTALALDSSGSRFDSATSARWTGRILTGIVVLFLAFDAISKLARVRQVVEGTVGILLWGGLYLRDARVRAAIAAAR